MSIHRLFFPRAAAVVGSMSEGKLGYELVRQIVDGGFSALSAVNPKGQGISAIPGYTSLAAIDHTIDTVIIATPSSAVAAVLEACGHKGIQAAIIISAGFSESGDTTGEQRIKEIAEHCHIRFIGPNCAGLVNTKHHFFPTLESRPPAGHVGLITQSGAVGGVFLGAAVEERLGISKFVNYGNGADLNEIELLEYFRDDSDTEVVCLYLESVSDGRRFMEAVRACSRIKPVIVLKSGRTQSGQRAAQSHTGALGGTDRIFDASLRQCGALRVFSVEEMFDLSKMLTFTHGMEGKRIAIVTNSGGPGVMAADAGEAWGLSVSEPSTTLKQRLQEFLPPQCSFRNPIDLTVEGTEEGYRKTLCAVLTEYDAALALNITTPYLDSLPLAQGICDAAEQTGKPIVATFLPRYLVSEAVSYLEGRGVPHISSPERAVAALARLTKIEQRQQHTKETIP